MSILSFLQACSPPPHAHTLPWVMRMHQAESEDFLPLLSDIRYNTPLHSRQYFLDALGPISGPWFHRFLLQDLDDDLDHSLPDPPKHHARGDFHSLHLHDSLYSKARALQGQFQLGEIRWSSVSHPSWVKQQLIEMRLGLSTLASALNLSDDLIGHGRLRFFLHEHALGSSFEHQDTHNGHSFFEHDHIVIAHKGGRITQPWVEWVAWQTRNNGSQGALLDDFQEWLNNCPKDPLSLFRRQQHALYMARRVFKFLTDTLHVESEEGERALRRYKSFCKWQDETERGQGLASILQGWTRFKTGNRIAWSGIHTFPSSFLREWKKTEDFVEQLFWKAHPWKFPSWTLSCLGHDGISTTKKQAKALGFGVESYVRSKIGYDSWAAVSDPCHPMRHEEYAFFSFVQNHFLKSLFNDSN